MSTPIPRLKKMVEYILEENPKFRGAEARNSDIALTIIIWQRWYNVGTNHDSTIHLYRLFDLPREDRVKRVRAIFQNTEGKYLPSDWKVAEKRGIAREVWEAALGYKLTADEMRVHKQTVKETTPPHIHDDNTLTEDGLHPIVYYDEATNMTDEQVDQIAKIIPRTPNTMAVEAVYKGRKNPRLNVGETYKLVMERLKIGAPVTILFPTHMSYRDIKAFTRDWRAQ